MLKDPAFWIMFGLFMVGAVVFMLVRAGYRTALDASAGNTEQSMVQLLAARTDFTASHITFSKTSNSLIAIDDNALQVALYTLQNKDIMVRTIAADLILNVQLLTDEMTHVTGLGSAVVGENSVLGVGQAFSSTKVESISLRFLLNSPADPLVDHYFLSATSHGKFDSNSRYVQDAIASATHVKALLDVLCHRASLRGAPMLNQDVVEPAQGWPFSTLPSERS